MSIDLALKDILGPAISLIGAALSAIFFWLGSKRSQREANRSIYVDGQKFVIEICKQLIDDPRLWRLYDNIPLSDQQTSDAPDPMLRMKLIAFAHLHLNMFEIIVIEAPNPDFNSEQDPSSTWIKYFHDTLNRSQIIRDVLDEEGSKQIWNPVLLKEYERWMKLPKPKAVTPQKPADEK